MAGLRQLGIELTHFERLESGGARAAQCGGANLWGNA
jgi:hypothetical protein